MIVAHVADLHLEHVSAARYGALDPESGANTRLLDFGDTLRRFVDLAVERPVDVAVLAGDTFHSRHPGPVALGILAEQLGRLQEAGIPALVLPGNHDGMNTVGWERSHTLRWMDALAIEGVHVLVKPGARVVQTKAGALEVASMPYPHKRAFDSQLSELDPDDRVVEAGRRVEAIVGAYAAGRVDAGLPLLFVGHLSVAGAALGAEQAMRMEWDAVVSSDAFAGFDYAALGHIHRQQRVGEKAWYAGSPDFHIFEDAGQPKAFLLATVERGKEPIVEAVPSGARKMGLLRLRQNPDGSWPVPSGGRSPTPAGATGPDAWYAGGPIIRLTLECATARPAPDEVAAAQRELLRKGASFAEVAVDASAVEEARARVDLSDPETGGQVAPEEALRRYLMAQGAPLEPALTRGRELIALARTGAAE